MELKEGYKQSEVGVIPEDWGPSRLGDHATFRTGPFGSALHKSDYIHGGIPVVNPMQIIDGQIVPTDSMAISEEAARKLSDFRLAVGEVVIGRRGDMGRCAYVTPEQDGWLCGTGSMIVRPSQSLDSRFAQRVLSSPPIISAIEDASVGTTMVNLNQGTLANLQIPFPPTKAEQEAIAKALSDADALIESLEQLIAKKRQIKQGAMQELLAGKKRLPGFSGEWEETTIGGLASLWKGGSNPGLHPERIFTHYSLPAFDNGRAPVTEPGRLIGSNKFTVPPSSVLLSKLNPRIPRIWAPDEIPENAVCSTEFLVLLPNEGTNREFLAILCSSNVVSDQMKLHATGTTGSHQRIHPPQAMAIELFIPSDPDEQTAIAAILSDMDAEITALETKLAKARQLKHGMMQELLTGNIRLIQPEKSNA